MTATSGPPHGGQLCTREVKRYQSKGYGLVFAILQLCALLYFQPIIARAGWAWVLEFMEKNNVNMLRMYAYFGFIQTWGIYLPSQIIFGFLYYIEWDLLERYKVVEEPWPWKEDPVRWKTYLLPKTIAIWCFNMLFLAPLTYCINEFLDEPVPYDLSADGIPDAGKFLA